MAVFPDQPGLSVVIMMDGKPLREYEPDDTVHLKDLRSLRAISKSLDHTSYESVGRIKYMVRYIEATSNKRFAFRLDKKASFPRDCHHLGVKWEVNNFETNIRHEPVDPINSDAHWTAECCRVGTGTAGEDLFWQYFRFSDLTTLENDNFDQENIKESTQEARDLGVLRVLIYKMQESTSSSTQTRFTPPWSIDQIPEKALKGRALTHTVQYEKERIMTGPPILLADAFQHPQKLPYAIFEFRYRSREGLMQEGIIPRTSRLVNMNEDEIVSLPHRVTPARRQPPLGVMMRPTSRRFKEVRRVDGKVVINLDSDEETNAASEAATVVRSTENTFVQDNMVIDLDSDDEDDSLFVPQRLDRSMRCETVEDDSLFARQRLDRRMRCETVEDEDSHLSYRQHQNSGSMGDSHSAVLSYADTALDPESNNNSRSPDRRARCETVDEDRPHHPEVLRYEPLEDINMNMGQDLDESGSDSDVTLQ